jgi:hypothetical protein
MDHFVYTEEALKAQDGKTVPLALENGGPVIGKAVMKYDADKKELVAEVTVNDDVGPGVRAFLNNDPSFRVAKVNKES